MSISTLAKNLSMATVGAVSIAVGFGTSAQAGILFAPSYNASTIFTDGLGETSMTIAYDGTNYWSSSGGNVGGNRYAQYDGSGNLLATYAPGLDFRSVFTDASGNVYARQFANPTIYKQTAPGVFAPSGVSLTGGTLDDQSSVVFNGLGTEYVANGFGTVSRWDTSGNSLGSVSLSGFGSVSGESDYPAGRGIAAAGNYWLTYNGNGILSAWDFAGNRVDQTTLVGAGTSFDSKFSLSYANGKVFVVDNPGGSWRGYDVGLSQTTPVPEPTATLGLLAIGALGATSALKRKNNQN